MYNLKREEINNITPISIESSNKKIFLKKINGKDGFTQNIILLQKNENNELINEYVFPLNVELNDNSYIDIEGIHINGSVIELSQEQLDFFNNIVCIEGVNVFEIDGNIQTEIEFNYVPLITEEIKNAVINNAEKAYIEVLDTGEIFDETNYLQEVKLNDERYVEGRGFIGSVIAKELTGKLINNNDDFYNLENKEIKYYDGPIMDNGSEKYFDYGTFIVQKPENDNVKDDTSFTAFDYMIKFNKKFEDRLDYSTGTVTVLELLEDICDQANVVLGTKNFRNSNFILENNQFVGGETCRDVLSNIAQIAFSWARINEDDELVLDFNPSNEIVETLNTDDYFDLKFNDLYGPINTIVLSNSVVTGENYTIHSPDFDPEIDEEIILEIQDNAFAYTEQKRYQLIQAGAALFGFQYVPITIKTCGRNYLNCLDKIRIKNVQNQNYDTYIFNNTLSYSGITLDEKKSPAMTNVEVKYECTGDLSKGLKRTEIIVDKQEQKIEGIVSEIGDRTEKTTTITADIDGLNSQVQEIADVTETAESIYASVSLEKINNSEPVEIKVHPIINNISYLYPRDNLYPSDDLYMTDRIIRFIRTYEEDEETKTENIDYLLPDDLLYYDSQIYDEFYLNYNTKTCQITKKCKYNSDGTVGLLSEPVITDYEYPKISLLEGDYEIEILEHNSGYVFAKLMLKNEYTSQFTTEVKMDSSIKETANEINLEVSRKVGENEIISKINQTAESVQITAEKINLNGVVTANNNFKILSDGSMEAKNAKFNGGRIELYKDVNHAVFGIYTDKTENPEFRMLVFDDSISLYNYSQSLFFLGTTHDIHGDVVGSTLQLFDSSENLNITLSGSSGHIECVSLTQTSLEEKKKNFEKLNNALDIIKNTDIYKYNFITEEDKEKKHIGFVIGENYKYSQEITSGNNNGVDTYSMISVAYKAIQEQQEIIEDLQKQINELKGDK